MGIEYCAIVVGNSLTMATKTAATSDWNRRKQATPAALETRYRFRVTGPEQLPTTDNRVERPSVVVKLPVVVHARNKATLHFSPLTATATALSLHQCQGIFLECDQPQFLRQKHSRSLDGNAEVCHTRTVAATLARAGAYCQRLQARSERRVQNIFDDER